MKKCSIFLACLAAVLLISCSGEKPGEEKVTGENESRLEDILDIPDEAALIKKYGKESISYDTIWGTEGFYELGTYLRTDEQTHVEIMWVNAQKRSGVLSATIVSDEDYYTAEKIQSGKWKSRTGVAVGMSLEDVEKINGRPFTFSGFEWDYGGGNISWEGGNLEGKGIGIQMSEGPEAPELTPGEANEVLGDVTVMSNSPVAAKLKPRVWSVSVAKVH